MRILYDHQIFSSQVFGGISRYFYELMRCYDGTAGITFELALCRSNNSYLQAADFARPKTFFKGRRFVGKTTLLNALNGYKSRQSLLKGDFDLFHPTYYHPYFLKYLGRKPYVVTVYDMVHELYPETFPVADRTREWKKITIGNATRIIAISESTRQDLARLYDLDENRVEVVHLAASLRGDGVLPASIQLPERYLLFVGQRGGYKNFRFFVSELARFMHDMPDLRLVCAGGGEFTREEESLFENLKVTGKVLQLAVSDELLATLYSNALAFVFPSLYEGFGIPILEAFACGCPVLTSNRSSLPEVAGDAALYIDPEDAVSLKQQLERIVSDGALRDELKARGSARVTEFSWERAARETKAVYESVL